MILLSIMLLCYTVVVREKLGKWVIIVSEMESRQQLLSLRSVLFQQSSKSLNYNPGYETFFFFFCEIWQYDPEASSVLVYWNILI